MDAKVWLMKRSEVCKMLSTSSSGLHRGMLEERYPRPYRTTNKSVRWKSNEVQAVIDALKVAEPVAVAPGAKKGRKRSVSSN